VKRAPWLAVPLATVDGLIRIYERQSAEWPREVAALDLARHLDLAAADRPVDFPSRRTLAKRWGWKESSVRGLLAATLEWSDPGKEERASREPNGRPTVAQNSPTTRPARKVESGQSVTDSPTTRPEVAQRSPTTRPNVLPGSLEDLAFEYGFSEVGTVGAITRHKTQDTSTETTHAARDTSATNPEPHMPTTDFGSRPTEQPHADDVTDANDPTACDPCSPLRADDDRQPAPGSGVVGVAGILGGRGGDDLGAGPADRLAGGALTSTPNAVPATTDPNAPPALILRGVAPLGSEQAGASKPKRGKGKQAKALDLDAWGRCCQAWDTVVGKIRVWRPEAGDGKTIAEAITRDGAAKIVARFEQATRDPWCCSTARDSGRPLSVSALTRSATAVTSRLDAAAEQAALDAESRSEGSVASGHTESRPARENRSQPPRNATGASAWDDMLTTIRATGGLRLSIGLRGSTLSHDPAEHERRCQAVRDIGGWPKLCEMGEGNRGIIRAQWAAAYDRLVTS